MAENKTDGVKFNVLAIVSHPDDEALWIGGTLHALSKFPEIRVSVICLSGADVSSPRAEEFLRAKTNAGYAFGVVLGGKLRSAHEPLPFISETLEKGLKEFDIDAHDVDLLMTHSPYGDEHMHPHHKQVSEEVYLWAKRNKVPFGYFSCIPVPVFRLRPLLRNMKRKGALQVLNVSKCEETICQTVHRILARKPKRVPKYFVQLLTDMAAKQSMLNCYESIDLEIHSNGYAMFTNNCESFYVFDERGMGAIRYMMDKMTVPGCTNLFSEFQAPEITMQRIIERLFIRNT